MNRSFVIQTEGRELLAIARALRATAGKLGRVSCELAIEAVRRFVLDISRKIVENAGSAGHRWA